MKIFITGSTDGIGKLSALELAREGNEIYLHGRNSDKLDQVVQQIRKESQNNQIHGFVADFSLLKDVKIMSQEVLNQLTSLDVLINNAGTYKTAPEMTEEGLDIHFAVNYLAPFILTNTLLPLFEKGSHPRVINLSSAAQAHVSLEALQGKVRLQPNEAYAQSKLALTMWSFYFAKMHPNITTIAVNPGSLLDTKLANAVYGRHWSSAEKGASILTQLAISPEFKNDSGMYFDNDLGEKVGDFNQAHPDAYNAQFIDELISTTKNIIKARI